MQTTVPLSSLHFGHEASPPINARKVGRDAEIASLKASISAHGLGQALNVMKVSDDYFVSDGNRRLMALFGLRDEGKLEPDAPIAVNVGDGDAGELSLALNIERVPMHEADQYEKFLELHQSGQTSGQIAARFGIEEKRVVRFLALGRLSPLILDAWREGSLGNNPTDAVRAFTLAATIADQETVFKQLKKSGQLWGARIRQALGGGNGEASQHLKFVGVEAYKAAGGTIIEDLFGEEHVVADPALAKRLAGEKLAAKIKDMKAEGWAWVEWDDDLPYSWNFSWQKVKGGKKASAADKAKSGVVLKFKPDATLEITYGVQKPVAAKAAARTAAKESGEPAPAATISNAMAQRLSVTISRAARTAIAANTHTALAAVLAGLGTSGYGLPIAVKAEGNVRVGREHEPFDELLGRYLEMDTEALLKALAAEAGNMVHFHTNYADKPILKSPPHSKLVEALDHEPLQAALREEFDAEDYFKTVPRSLAEAAIAEAVNADEARKAGKLKKGELVKFCVENVPKTGWLPPELRTSTYAGPAPVKAAKVTAKTEAAKAKLKPAGKAKATQKKRAA